MYKREADSHGPWFGKNIFQVLENLWKSGNGLNIPAFLSIFSITDGPKNQSICLDFHPNHLFQVSFGAEGPGKSWVSPWISRPVNSGNPVEAGLLEFCGKKIGKLCGTYKKLHSILQHYESTCTVKMAFFICFCSVLAVLAAILKMSLLDLCRTHLWKKRWRLTWNSKILCFLSFQCSF